LKPNFLQLFSLLPKMEIACKTRFKWVTHIFIGWICVSCHVNNSTLIFYNSSKTDGFFKFRIQGVLLYIPEATFARVLFGTVLHRQRIMAIYSNLNKFLTNCFKKKKEIGSKSIVNSIWIISKEILYYKFFAKYY
jgi:hypothetical protein